METDLAQMLAFCVVMLDSALDGSLGDPGILQNAGLASGGAQASLDTLRSELDQVLDADAAAEAIREIGAATTGMPGAERVEAVAFCAEMANEP